MGGGVLCEDAVEAIAVPSFNKHQCSVGKVFAISEGPAQLQHQRRPSHVGNEVSWKLLACPTPNMNCQIEGFQEIFDLGLKLLTATPVLPIVLLMVLQSWITQRRSCTQSAAQGCVPEGVLLGA